MWKWIVRDWLSMLEECVKISPLEAYSWTLVDMPVISRLNAQMSLELHQRYFVLGINHTKSRQFVFFGLGNKAADIASYSLLFVVEGL